MNSLKVCNAEDNPLIPSKSLCKNTTVVNRLDTDTFVLAVKKKEQG